MHHLIFDYRMTTMKENGKNNNKKQTRKRKEEKGSVNRKVWNIVLG